MTLIFHRTFDVLITRLHLITENWNSTFLVITCSYFYVWIRKWIEHVWTLFTGWCIRIGDNLTSWIRTRICNFAARIRIKNYSSRKRPSFIQNSNYARVLLQKYSYAESITFPSWKHKLLQIFSTLLKICSSEVWSGFNIADYGVKDSDLE